MKKTYRRALLFAAVFSFMAVTPVVILYALGYRTTLTAADPIPVGVLLVDSEPSQAKLYVNDTYIGQTPHSLSRPAGVASVRIEKEGYITWQKQLDVRSGRATEIRDVRLFPAAVEPTTIASNARSFSLSPNRRLLSVVHKNNTLAVYDQAGEVIVPAQFFAKVITNQLWSPNSDALLVTTGNPPAVWHVPLTERAIPAPVAVSVNGSSGVVWDPRIPGRLLYVDAANMLQAYTFQSGIQVALIPQVPLFATSANYIYVVDEVEHQLVEYSLQGQLTGTEFPLPEGQTSAVSQLLVTPQKNIAVRFTTGEVWVLGSNDRFEQVGSGIATVAWSPTGKVLLLTTDTSSLYVYNVNDKRTTLPLKELRLVQRLSRPIIDPRWFAGGRHVVYQVDDAVWITEIDTRDHPISFEVDTTNTGSAQAAVGEEGEVMFYLKNTATDTTLVAAPLLVP